MQKSPAQETLEVSVSLTDEELRAIFALAALGSATMMGDLSLVVRLGDIIEKIVPPREAADALNKMKLVMSMDDSAMDMAWWANAQTTVVS